MTTVLTESSTTSVSSTSADALWLSPDEVSAATGWTLKPEGLCKDDQCVPVPTTNSEHFIADDQVNLSALWSHMGKAATSTDAGDVWFLGEGAASRNDQLMSLAAPEFTLPDFDGKLHSITDFQRQRVLLITWASW